MEWYDSYSIGVEEIDNQHRKLVDMISRLQATLPQGASGKEIAEALKFIVDYTQFHFRSEEDLMRKIAFAEIETHKKLHTKLIRQVTDILLNLKKGKIIDTYDLVDFLTSWLITHIRDEDKKIGKAIDKIEVYKG